MHIKLRFNRAVGREFVPDHNTLVIEPAGVCNLGCVMCAYPKKTIGKTVTSNEAFADRVVQALDAGFPNLSLTSNSGELFMDKNVAWKFDFLESQERLNKYEFYTNFVLADADRIEQIRSLKKLDNIVISVYGFDLETFCQFTDRPPNQYYRLIENLNLLAERPDDFHTTFEFAMRAPFWFKWDPSMGAKDDDSDLMKVMAKLCVHPRFTWGGNLEDFDSFGGTITEEDVAGLDIRLMDGRRTPKVGPCILLCDNPIVHSDGAVNACGCRATDRSLLIGNVNTNPLSEILSDRNPAYMDLLQRQIKDDYPDTCKKCIVYKSIYRPSRGWKSVSLDGFFTRLNKRGNGELSVGSASPDH